MRSSVDFPMPLGPTMPRRVPAVTATDTPPSTTCAPWWRTRSFATSTTSDATGRAPPISASSSVRMRVPDSPVDRVLEHAARSARSPWRDPTLSSSQVTSARIDAERADALEALAQDLAWRSPAGGGPAAPRSRCGRPRGARKSFRLVTDRRAPHHLAVHLRHEERRARRSGPSAAHRAGSEQAEAT